MKAMDNRLIDWAISVAETEYPDQIAVILSHNSTRLEQDQHIRFASHIIADGEIAEKLSRTVIIDGIGYDFFQQSWEDYERDAEAKGYFLSILAEADIVYCRAEDDRQRFLCLRKQLKDHLADADYMYQRGLEWVSQAMELYRNMLFEADFGKVRKAAGYIADYLSVAVACLNQTYFKGNTRLPELRAMKMLPRNFCEACERMTKVDDAAGLINLCHEMIVDTRALFGSCSKPKSRSAPNYEWLAEWYQECSYYFRRICHACAVGEAVLAFREVCWLQADLDDIAVGFGLDGLDVTAHFDADDLAASAEWARQAEKRIAEAIQANNVQPDVYGSIDEFVRRNS